MFTKHHHRNPFLLISITAAGFLLVSLYIRVLILEGKIFTPRPKADRPLDDTTIPRVTIPINPDDPAQGPADAKVTIVEFADYLCSYCAALEGTNSAVIAQLKKDGYWTADDVAPVPEIIKDYVEKGLVRLVWKDFPALGIDSFYAAASARCAGEQNKFWEYHNKLFGLQETSIGLTGDVLDEAAFDECTTSERHLPTAKKNKEEGQALGITATPTMFINGMRVPGGANPYSLIKPLIEQELAK